ncbi:MAG TPA: phosphoribosylformylglycinamidine synthase [Polyangia bacterium]|nr:phosphoribosylformylglycinamidine synthase [Polyangia bacterium]
MTATVPAPTPAPVAVAAAALPTMVVQLPGGAALGPARLAKRLRAIRVDNPGVADLDAQLLHFAGLAGGPLGEADATTLGRLLRYGPTLERREIAGHRLLVVPRIGTISPWSSKATDIAHICGLSSVRRLERGVIYTVAGEIADGAALRRALHDRMTESVLEPADDPARLFAQAAPRPLATLPVSALGRIALEEANAALGLALAPDEIAYLCDHFRTMGRDPTDVELMMFAQANSEHCRHKIFNATFVVDGVAQSDSLFQMIRRSTQASPRGVLSAYRDNAAVIEGTVASRFFPDPHTGVFGYAREPVHVLMKVETHNHPTAISPYPGAATGSGGEIRDEGATGRGAKPKAGLTGFSVSNLRLPGALRPWEQEYGKPDRIVSALDIMLDGPVGGAAFNNEFGRPNLCGYFRTLEIEAPGLSGREVRGYHKPIMIAGGLGNVRSEHVHKAAIPAGAPIVVLGGPAMLIGLGGGAASSLAAGASHEDLDFASVQRDNAEMQRRCQEVIDGCWARGAQNPILSIHDVGAGGLSNALPELVHDSGRGARFELRHIPSDEPGMSPLEIWCNEAQERYVLAIAPDRMAEFEGLAARERCPYAVVGEATDDGRLIVDDSALGRRAIDMPLAVLLGKPPRMTRRAARLAPRAEPFDPTALGIDLREAALRLLRLPAVADKTFLVTIGDRTVGGLCARDPMVGPWQVPVADAALTTAGLDTSAGEAMAMGERAPIALLDAAASARMAVAETITNLAAAPIARLGDIKLSANWMAAAGHPGEDARLYDAVRAVGAELCPALGIAIPVGKDSMSMRTAWQARGEARSVTAPVSLIVSGFAPVTDVRRALTPELRTRELGTRDVSTAQGSGGTSDTILLLIDLGRGQNRLGGSGLAQVFGQVGAVPPDLDSPGLLVGFFAAIQELSGAGSLLAYHDRSDGGLWVTLLEMAFAGGAGLDVDIAALPRAGTAPLAALFNEELGAVVQVRADEVPQVTQVLARHGLGGAVHPIGRPVAGGDRVVIRRGTDVLLDESRASLRGVWSETTHALQALRDDPTCADEEQAGRVDPAAPGLTVALPFDPDLDIAGPFTTRGARPRVAILREQGVNGQVEMAAAFHRAGFDAVDVHMTDVLSGRIGLADFRGLAVCGGFSYGDVLGAGEGWAKSILFNARARDELAAFFARDSTFTLGVCNGCQMLSALKELVPGAAIWPRFVRNRSDQFEARLALVAIEKSPSVLLIGMAGMRAPIATAHGEGRAELLTAEARQALEDSGLIAARFVDGAGQPTELYPQNPNGSPGGVTALTTPDGRATILMPHPERAFRSVQLSWRPRDWNEDSPWMRMFRNARVFVG